MIKRATRLATEILRLTHNGKVSVSVESITHLIALELVKAQEEGIAAERARAVNAAEWSADYFEWQGDGAAVACRDVAEGIRSGREYPIRARSHSDPPSLQSDTTSTEKENTHA